MKIQYNLKMNDTHFKNVQNLFVFQKVQLLLLSFLGLKKLGKYQVFFEPFFTFRNNCNYMLDKTKLSPISAHLNY